MNIEPISPPKTITPVTKATQKVRTLTTENGSRGFFARRSLTMKAAAAISVMTAETITAVLIPSATRLIASTRLPTAITLIAPLR